MNSEGGSHWLRAPFYGAGTVTILKSPLVVLTAPQDIVFTMFRYYNEDILTFSSLEHDWY